jgi:hypothetical protein
VDNSTTDLPDPFVDDPELRKLIRITDDGHWLWLGEIDRDGYGTVFRDGYHWRAHRWVYALVHGLTELPIDHVCRTRDCVNPAHLEAVTTAVNNERIPRPETCPAGHRNWSIRSDGARRCLSCHRARERERKRRQRST